MKETYLDREQQLQTQLDTIKRAVRAVFVARQAIEASAPTLGQATFDKLLEGHREALDALEELAR